MEQRGKSLHPPAVSCSYQPGESWSVKNQLQEGDESPSRRQKATDTCWRPNAESLRVPYVLIVLPLAASSGGPGCLVRVSNIVAGRTLTSAPVLMRNCLLVIELHRKSRP